jgi:hypothetical protein
LMDGQERRKAMDTVAEVFSEWKTVHDKLKELEKAYKKALTDHAAHVGPFPQARGGSQDRGKQKVVFAQTPLLSGG